MAQRSITSYFNTSAGLDTSKDDESRTLKTNGSSLSDGKRKRESSVSPDSPSTKKGSKATPKATKSPRASKAKDKSPTKQTLKKKTTEPSPTKSSPSKKLKLEAGEKAKNKKKRARIINDDSSDEDVHLKLPDTPEKSPEAKEISSSPKAPKSPTPLLKLSKDDDSSKSDGEDSDSSKKSPPPEESLVKISSFFQPKSAKTSKSPKVKSKDSAVVGKGNSNFFKGTSANDNENKSAKSEHDKHSVESYNPSIEKYHPIDNACWKRDEKVPYVALTRTLELIESTSSRLKIVEILANYFRSVIVLSPEDLLPSVYLCLNQLAPAYEGQELGIADTTLIKAIAQCTGRTTAQIKADAKEAGDLGIVAEGSRSNQKVMFQPAPLAIAHVFAKLKDISKMTGTASVGKKLDIIQTLFVACRYTEARYLIRSLAGKLRIGLAEQSVLQALALACAKTPPTQNYPPEIINASKKVSSDEFKKKYDEIALIIKTTYCECPNYDRIIPVILKDGVEALPDNCKLKPGIPPRPMLAHPTKGVQEVLTRFEGLKFTCEWKYDGERAQIHVSEDGKMYIYSRNQENNTSKYPDIIGRLKNTLGDDVKSCILDCEAVAWDCETKQILPFQILSTRKRKDANEADIKVQVCVFMFDLLYFNGEALVKKPFIKRRELLKQNFKEVEGQWHFATSLDTSTMEEVQEFLEVSVKGNCEGLMVKTLEEDATYEIAKRSRNWLKLKKDYLEGVGDTLDVVVIGGYIGKGKRTGTYGGFLLACYDQQNEEYQSLCKIGTGFTESDLEKHSTFLKEHIIPQAKQYYCYDNSLTPDHWFEPVQVWEIKCADLSLSPVHHAAAGIVDPQKGISLRFPRFIRVREDKKPEDSTSARQIADMYNSQDQIVNKQASAASLTEEDFY